MIQTRGSGDGAYCAGASEETFPCNPDPGQVFPPKCEKAEPVNCVLTPFSGWSQCTAPCGGGMQVARREIVTYAANGGTPCDGSLSKVQECGRQPCPGPAPQDCKLGDWQEWGECGKCNG